MRPDYEKRAKKLGTKSSSISFRITPEMEEKLDNFAEVEQDKVAQLCLEGVMRVIDDREQDPEYMAGLKAAGEAKITRLQAEIEQTRISFGLPDENTATQ